jgi:hypothetical protein
VNGDHRVRHFEGRNGDELAAAIEEYLSSPNREFVAVSFSKTRPSERASALLVYFDEGVTLGRPPRGIA